jgi:hypothetical protein
MKLNSTLMENIITIITNDAPDDYNDWKKNAIERDEVYRAAHRGSFSRSSVTPKKKKKKAKCAKCGHTNHKTEDCFTKKIVNMIRIRGGEGSAESQRLRNLLVQGQRLTALVDTRADVSCIHTSLARDVPQQTNIPLMGPTGEVIATKAPYVLDTIDRMAQKLYLVDNLLEEVVLSRPYLEQLTPRDVLSIDTLETPADGGRIRPLSIPEQEALNKEIDSLQALRVIQPSHATITSNILFVPKKNRKLRMCVNYRNLNKVTRKDSYPLLLLTDILETARHLKYFLVINLEATFHNVKVQPSDVYTRQCSALIADSLSTLKCRLVSPTVQVLSNDTLTSSSTSSRGRTYTLITLWLLRTPLRNVRKELCRSSSALA